MTRSIPAAVLGSLISATSAGAQVPELPFAPVPSPLRGEVIEFLSSYYESFTARDWDRFADHFWPGAIITTVSQPEGEPAPRVVTQTVDEFVTAAPVADRGAFVRAGGLRAAFGRSPESCHPVIMMV